MPRPGEIYGKWTILRDCGTEKPARNWIRFVDAQCECGTIRHVQFPNMLHGRSTNCGCQRKFGIQKANSTHGKSGTPEYHIWSGIYTRCTNPRRNSWGDYGGRGIVFAQEFHNFENFLAEVGPRPGPKFTIERIDNDRGYVPGNIRWATRAEQRRNRRDTVLYDIDGERLCLADAAKKKGIRRETVRARRDAGWPIEDWFIKANG